MRRSPHCTPGITQRKQAELAIKDSEEMFRNLVEQSPNMIFINANGRIVYANKKCEEVMGYKIKEFYSPKFDFTNLIAPEYKKLISTNLKAHKADREAAPYECAVLTKEGMRIDVITTTKLIEYGGESAILGVVTDITERKRIENTLAESQSKYETIVENVNDGIVIIQNGLLKFVNSRILGITGFSMKEVAGKPFIDFISQSFKKSVDENYKRRMTGIEIPHRYESELVSKDGRIIPVEINASLIEYNGKLADLAIIRDIAKRRNYEVNIKKQVDDLRKLDEAKTEFIYIAGHELRSPVQSLMLAGDMLGEEPNLTENQEKYLGVIRRETVRLRGLINNLLDLSAMGLGKFEFDMREVRMHKIVDAIREEKALKAGEKGIKMTFSIPEDLPVILGDRERLTQVLVNIIGNAIKFTHEGGAIDMAAKEGKDEVVVCVKDTGIGIPEELQGKIFNRFVQAQTMVGKREGFGLGLAISSEIIKVHGGRIWFESKEGSGSRFYFSIPVKR